MPAHEFEFPEPSPEPFTVDLPGSLSAATPEADLAETDLAERLRRTQPWWTAAASTTATALLDSKDR